MELATKAFERNGAPTLDDRASVRVVTLVDGQELPLSRAELWHDGESFVVRSLEFDLLAEGQDLDDAIRAFGSAIYRYADDLRARVDEGAASENEREMLRRLSDRLFRIYLAERRGRPRRRRWLPRRRHHRGNSWRPAVTG